MFSFYSLAPLERKKEVFFRLDELDKVLEYIHTKLSTVSMHYSWCPASLEIMGEKTWKMSSLFSIQPKIQGV